MLPITLSIIACFGWGISDFIGGYKSRQLKVLTVLTVSTLSGLFLISLVILVHGRPIPHDPDLVWAVLAGPIGMAAMYLLYRSLAVGVMAILAPISATGVILPVLWGLLCGDTMSNLSLMGIVIAILGSLLAIIETKPVNKKKPFTRGVGLALSSAVLVGLYFIFMDRASTYHPLWAAFIMRSATSICLIPLLFITRTPVKVGPPHLFTILFMGAADVTAAFCFALAASGGMLSQVAVISSLYPAVTVSLSTWIAKERMAGIQAAGVCLAITGVVLISAF